MNQATRYMTLICLHCDEVFFKEPEETQSYKKEQQRKLVLEAWGIHKRSCKR